MSEEPATDEQITEALNNIIAKHEDTAIKLLAKLVFNLMFDLDELKLHLLKAFKNEGIEIEDIDLVYPDKEINTEIKRFYNDFYS